MPRTTVTMLNKASLAEDSDTEALLNTPASEVHERGELSVQCIIDNGAGGAPTDTPVGVWELYCSATSKDADYSPVVIEQLTTALARIAPNGNIRISAWVSLRGVPGKFAKFRYKKGSGGATSTRCTLNVTRDDDD